MKKLESKLAAGIRRVKAEQAGTPMPQPYAPEPAPADYSARAASTGGEQSPAPSLYDPWSNLFPRRIWPD